MKVLNKIHLIVILVFVALGSFAFLSPYFIKKSGVVVVSVSNPGCQNIHVGDIITEVGGNQVKNIQDFTSVKFQPKQFVSLVVNSGPAGCVAMQDGSIGVDVKSTVSSGIIFGVDLVGGKKYKIDSNGLPAAQLKNISAILSARTSYLGLPDVKIQQSGSQLEIVTGKDTNVNQLLFIGYLEGNIEEGVALKNGSGNFQIENNNYTLTETDSKFLVNKTAYGIGESFYLGDVKTSIVNKTNTSVVVSLTIFNNSDILGEVPGYSQVSFDSNSGKYSFSVLARLSTSASKRFSDIVQNVKTMVVGTQVSLDSALVFKLDGVELSRLGMPASLKGQAVTTLYIVGSDESKDNLLYKKSMVDAVINSGILPENLSISGTEDFGATQRNNILPLLGIIVFSVAIVPLLLAAKHKNIKHNLLSIIIGFSEIFSILSIFIALQVFYKLNFALDFAALLGLALLSLNWMLNVISVNTSRHSHRDLLLKFKYKKIISLTGLTKVLLVVAAFTLGAYGYASASAIIIIGVILDYLIFRSFYKSFTS